MVGKYTYISTATTTIVKPGPSILMGILITETAAGAITVYDNASAASGDVIALFKASIAEGYYEIDTACRNGIVIVTAAASKLTVVYR